MNKEMLERMRVEVELVSKLIELISTYENASKEEREDMFFGDMKYLSRDYINRELTYAAQHVLGTVERPKLTGSAWTLFYDYYALRVNEAFNEIAKQFGLGKPDANSEKYEYSFSQYDSDPNLKLDKAPELIAALVNAGIPVFLEPYTSSYDDNVLNVCIPRFK